MTMKRLVLCLALLMSFQISSRLLVQPSCLVFPHMPWLSGVLETQRKAAVGAAGTLMRGTASGAVGESVSRQPRASATRGSAMVGRAHTGPSRRVCRRPLRSCICRLRAVLTR